MIDKTALYSLSLGIYIFTTLDGERGVGRTVDAVSQVSADPKRLGVSLMKNGYTTGIVEKGGRFALTTIARDADLAVVEAFGYQSSESIDKFAGFDVAHDEAGVPYVTNGAVAEISCEVIDVLDMGSHVLVVGEVVEAHTFRNAEPLTYAGFRALKAAASGAATAAAPAASGAATAPAAAPAASTEPSATEQVATGKTAWRCKICGFVIEVEELPDDYKCPLCGQGKEVFEKITL